jgi:hypothetical protein
VIVDRIKSSGGRSRNTRGIHAGGLTSIGTTLDRVVEEIPCTVSGVGIPVALINHVASGVVVDNVIEGVASNV